jgi:hypothetical protein
MIGTLKRSATSARASRRDIDIVAVVGLSRVGLQYTALGPTVLHACSNAAMSGPSSSSSMGCSLTPSWAQMALRPGYTRESTQIDSPGRASWETSAARML